MTTTAEYQARTQAAMTRGLENAPEQDWSGWPEDVRELGELFCNLYHFHPPTTKSGKAFWITSLRDLIDAAGEWGKAAIVEQRRVFKAEMEKNMDKGLGGIAPFTVDSPKSIVNDVRGTAARMRESGYVDTGYSEGSPYTTGRYAEWIEH